MSEIDLNKILEEIKAAAEKRRRENPEIELEIQRMRQYFQPRPQYPDARFQELDFNVRRANLGYNPTEPGPNTRFSFLKKAVLRLIRPYTRPQIEFNANLVRALNKCFEIILEQHETIRTLQKEPQHVVDLVRTLNDMLHDDRRQDTIRKLTEIYEQSRNAELRSIAEQNRRFLQTGDLPAGFDYALFEDRFRGSESEIKARQKKYLEYFQHNEPVIDLACGRGEFLELLREENIAGSGVELNPQMAARCREKDLEVEQKDLFDYLRSAEEGSLGGIFAAQVIEHMNHIAVLHLIALASAKLRLGGVMILETINPASLFVFAHSMYLDPTHVQPYHPPMLEFLCQNFGFSRSEVLFSAPVDETFKLPPLPGADAAQFNQATERLNNLLYAHQDYAVIAYK